MSPTAKPKARVLVVDNDPWIPRMAATILGQAGYLVNVAADAQGAIASAVKAPPRVILSAVTLPALDNRPWWERLRAIVDGRVIPFVFLTAPGVVPADIRGFLSEVDDCLAKPFRVEELERVVRDALLRVPHPSVAAPGEPPRPPMVTPVSTRASQWHRPLLALRGMLSEIGLGSLLVMLEMERKSGILIIETETATARFFLRKGHIMRAELDGVAPMSGATAVYGVLGWKEGQFEFLIGDVGGIDEIQTSTTFLLIEAARRADELKEQERANESLKGQQLLSRIAAVVDADDDGNRATEIISLRIEVPRECDGWRLDHFLKRRIGRLSRTRIQNIIATQVTLADGRRPRSSASVRAGQIIHLDRPAPIEPEVPRHFDVLYEDADVLAIDKPAGLPMHPSAKFYRNTLTALLRERYPDEPMQIAHRIDRETSGVLLVARTAGAASWLKRAFARRAVDKSYLALVKGQPPDEGVIDRPIKLLDTPSHVMMGPAADGLKAVTRFRVVQRFANHALCAAHPETGRQHQIRVHLAAIGHPIVGDKIYGAGERYFMRACDEEAIHGRISDELLTIFDGLPRHALHAHRLTFLHPRTRAPMTIESPWPTDLVVYVESLSLAAFPT